MCDFVGFPAISRFFYLKDTLMSPFYALLKLDTRFPHLYGWFKRIREDPAFQPALMPLSAFQLYVEELLTLPLGKKPNFRL